ncbi:tyrosine--tRNA ligase [Candidatus Saccharibacteria bacterium]|nr:tyrosine--tRNA ligase [Candidatus Saccharibacteria bacterium]
MSKMTLSEELEWRGFVDQTTFQNITELDTEKRTFYWGVDPSASSMQIGNLAAAMMARVFISHGYTPVLLVGGATGLIGDPDGKAQERDLKTPELVEQNKKGIIAQYKQVFDGFEFKVVDNYDWFKNMNYLAFLREVGKHVPMRQMLARDFVQSRLGEKGAGISYAEFSYSLIQGYDFLHLFEKHGVTLQLSGTDQWGNSITGVDLIRRKTGKEAHVWTMPLIINKATGVKFGKTEDGAVWLDPEQTSVFKFYQFWLNADDGGVEDYLKIYTSLDKSSIDEIMAGFQKDPADRSAQKRLAQEVTTIVHGASRAASSERVTDVLFGGADFTELKAEDVALLKDELVTVQAQANVAATVVKAGLASSNSEANRFIAAGAITVNGQKVTPEQQGFDSGASLLKRGKNSFAIIEQK